MTNVMQLLVAFFAGVLLGGCYFGGLWWTVRRLPRARHVWRLYFGSLLVRLALVLVSFYFVLTYFDWRSLVACLLGFVASRLVLTQVLGDAHPDVQTERGI